MKNNMQDDKNKNETVDNTTSRNTNLICAGCGEGPYSCTNTDSSSQKVEGTTIIPLKACSRCYQVWYHNRDCQLKHYPTHRTACLQFVKGAVASTNKLSAPSDSTINTNLQRDMATLRVNNPNPNKENTKNDNMTTTTTTTTADETAKESSSLGYQIMGKPTKLYNDRGRYVIATKSYKPNEIICSAIPSFVPATISKDERSKRCSVCLCPLRNGTKNTTTLSNHPKYIVKVCSTCSSTNQIQWIKDEVTAVTKLLKKDAPDAISYIMPTGILLYRIILYCSESATNEEQILDFVKPVIYRSDSLLCNVPDHFFIYQDSCVWLVVQLLQLHSPEKFQWLMVQQQKRSTQYYEQQKEQKGLNKFYDRQQEEQQHDHRYQYVVDIIRRMLVNQFGVVHDTGNDRIEVGYSLFRDPGSRFNHSCGSNAEQQFVLSPGQYPCLRIRAKQAIQANDEITISYMNPSDPYEVRQENFRQHYFFDCMCHICSNFQR